MNTFYHTAPESQLNYKQTFEEMCEAVISVLVPMRFDGVSKYKSKKVHKYELNLFFRMHPLAFIDQLTNAERDVLNLLYEYGRKHRTILVTYKSIAVQLNLHEKYVCEVISRLHYFGLFYKKQTKMNGKCLILLDYAFWKDELRNRLSYVMPAFRKVAKWVEEKVVRNAPKGKSSDEEKPHQMQNPTLTKDMTMYKKDFLKDIYSNIETNSDSISSTFGRILPCQVSPPAADFFKRDVKRYDGTEYDAAQMRNDEMNADILGSILGNLHLLDE